MDYVQGVSITRTRCMPNMLRSTQHPNKQIIPDHQIITTYLQDHVALPLGGVSAGAFIREYLRRWNRFQIFGKYLRKAFSFLVRLSICPCFLSDTSSFHPPYLLPQQDRFYVSYYSLPSLKETGFSQFKSIIEEPFRNVLYKSIISACRQVFFIRC